MPSLTNTEQAYNQERSHPSKFGVSIESSLSQITGCHVHLVSLPSLMMPHAVISLILQILGKHSRVRSHWLKIVTHPDMDKIANQDLANEINFSDTAICIISGMDMT